MKRKTSTPVLSHANEAERQDAAQRAAKTLQAGGLVAFATETVYGIAAIATDPRAMTCLRELKSRPARPFSVHVARPEDVSRYVANVPIAAGRLISRAWPGPVTLIMPTGGRLADEALEAAGLHRVLCAEGMIGIRCPDMPLARDLLTAVAQPVVATSANPAGAEPPRTAQEVLAELDGRIDLLVDSGPSRYGKDSTIVRFVGDTWEVVREGVCDEKMIGELLAETWLFVCTGNTCRSPVAEGLARKLLAKKLKCKVGELLLRGYRMLSAGVSAGRSGGASPDAIQAAREKGVSLSAHRTRGLTAELIRSADVIFCMSNTHVSAVLRLVPSASAKVRLLDETSEIPDPIGGGIEACRRSAARIARAVKKYVKEDGR